MPMGIIPFGMALGGWVEFLATLAFVRWFVATITMTAVSIAGMVLGICSGRMGEDCPAIKRLSNETLFDFDAPTGPCDVPMYNFAMCRDQLMAQEWPINSSIPEPGVAQFDYIPPACMNLASVLVDSCNVSGHNPIPCGSACLKYTNLTDVEMKGLSAILNNM